MQIKDKVVVITGGSKGLGKIIAKTLANKAARVIISDIDKKALQSTAKELGVIPIFSDISDEEQVIKMTKKIVDQFGQIDIWINNAGLWMPHVPIEKTDWQRVHDLMEVNFFGTVYGSKAAMLQMRKQGSGMIVNVLSMNSLRGRRYNSGYCASKHAANGFTKSLELEVEGQNIKVISIYLGRTKTSLFNEAIPDNYDELMNPVDVAKKIITNMEKDNPRKEQIIRKN